MLMLLIYVLMIGFDDFLMIFMIGFVVFDLVFQYSAKRLAGKNERLNDLFLCWVGRKTLTQ